MRKAIKQAVILVSLLIMKGFLPTTTAQASGSAGSGNERAVFKKIWVDYDITEDSKKGMRIHLKFSTYDMKDMDAYVAIYFQDRDGYALKDNNKSYYSTSGDVALYKSIKPAYDNTDYDDLQMFMPYSELDRSPGSYKLKMDVKVIYSQGGTISQLTKYDFDYDKPSSSTTTNNNSSVSAQYKDMWVDYGVYEDGKKGMRIHTKFTVTGMKETDCYLAIYFQDKDGNALRDTNKKFYSEAGDVAVYKLLTPSYEVTDYNDLKVFMPYDELELSSGKYDLKMDVDLIYKNGDMIEHFKYYDFWYEN